MIHILNESKIEYELVDCATKKVDVTLAEKDDNIFFPQIFKFDQHKWRFAGSAETIVEWHDAGILQSRLSPRMSDDPCRVLDDESPTAMTSPTDKTASFAAAQSATPSVVPTVAPVVSVVSLSSCAAEIVQSVPDWSKRAGGSDYMTLIPPKQDESGPTNLTNGVALHVSNHDHGVLLASYNDLMAKHLSTEHEHKQKVTNLESLVAKLSLTSTEISAPQTEHKRSPAHEKDVLLGLLRLESERAKVANLERKVGELERKVGELERKVGELEVTIEQQDGEIKTYDGVVETSQKTVVLHERAKHDLTHRALVHEAQIAELVAKLDQVSKSHAEKEQQLTIANEEDANTLRSQHASELESSSLQRMSLEHKVAELLQVVGALEQTVEHKNNTEHELHTRVTEQNDTIVRLHSEQGMQQQRPTSEEYQRRDDLEFKRQFIQLCRLQNEKERLLLSQVASALFLP